MSLIVATEFFERAVELREFFSSRFAHPFEAAPDRFVWDYWHVPGQFTYLRTLARHFFPQDLFRSFQSRLTGWGKDRIGCAVISEPWLSYYIDGCRQELHADVPNGPWSYVFSLTDWEGRQFSGGETLLLTPQCLDLWRGRDHINSGRPDNLIMLVQPLFNQLTVFDARIPHGVRTVEGVRDPCSSRIVIHGWFRPPELILSENLQRMYRPTEVKTMLQPLEEQVSGYPLAGLVTIRLLFGARGSVDALDVLSNTLHSTQGDMAECDAFIHKWSDLLATLTLPQVHETAWIIVPLQLPVPNASKTGDITRGVFS